MPVELDPERSVLRIGGPFGVVVEIGAGHDPYKDGYDFFDFPISMSGPALAAKTSVRSMEGPAGLRVFFRRLADDWKGLQGDRDWESIEHDLTIQVRHDPLGHVRLTFILRESYMPDAWTVQGTVQVEAGEEMAHIADAVEQLLQ